jgi:hypothetical protein
MLWSSACGACCDARGGVGGEDGCADGARRLGELEERHCDGEAVVKTLKSEGKMVAVFGSEAVMATRGSAISIRSTSEGRTED